MPQYLSAIMNMSFSRDSILKRRTEEQQRKYLGELKGSIEYTKSEIESAMRNFNNVTEPRLVDFYIYKIQSEQSRYDQLMVEYKAASSAFCGGE